jgi:hypothetical protein
VCKLAAGLLGVAAGLSLLLQGWRTGVWALAGKPDAMDGENGMAPTDAKQLLWMVH